MRHKTPTLHIIEGWGGEGEKERMKRKKLWFVKICVEMRESIFIGEMESLQAIHPNDHRRRLHPENQH